MSHAANGRSRPFWEHFYPRLQKRFPSQLDNVDLDSFYRVINRVHPSYIRVEADEVTYNLYIMLRFEMEVDLLSGTLPVSDAPRAWNDKMESYLGVRPPDDRFGILQDTHWASALVGSFPTYAPGNFLSVQLYDRAIEEVPTIPDGIRSGDFRPLHGWMVENVYRHGRKFTPDELVERVTGERLKTRSYLRYLHTRFGAIYGLA